MSIIDCFKVFTERPFDLTARTRTWSNHNHHQTIKYLIGIIPAGAVKFHSQGWVGRVSDKEFTIRIKFFEKLQHGDTIFADRGFTIKQELATYGATLTILHFTRGKLLMSVKKFKNLEKYQMLESTLNVSLAD